MIYDITWKFIVKRAPCRGSVWEACWCCAITSEEGFGILRLILEELETVVAKVESARKKRQLSFMQMPPQASPCN